MKNENYFLDQTYSRMVGRRPNENVLQNVIKW